jgi:hypothetical protein
MKLPLTLLCLAPLVCAVEQRYPAHPNVIDVTQPPYLAKGDGVTDCTEALQKALNENVGRHRVLWFPRGTYLISATLTWPKKWDGKDNWGHTMLRGQERDRTTIRLKDATFTDAKKPESMMWCGGFGSADWFFNHIENLTFDVGKQNPGATALQFYSNNTGAVRDCHFVAEPGSGQVGLDLAHRDMNGPLLIKNCEVSGFRVGISTARAVNSQTFEHITLKGQTEVGFKNSGQHVSIRGLTCEAENPALITYGRLLLVEARLTGSGRATKVPAIINHNRGRLFVRDIAATGYKRVVADLPSPDVGAAMRLPADPATKVAEYSSHPAASAFASPPESLRLPLKETPVPVWDDPSTWATVSCRVDDPKGRADYADEIQKAVDSGASTVFLPENYHLSRTVILRGKVRRVLGISGSINYWAKDPAPDFRIEAGDGSPIFIESFSGLRGGLELTSRRTVVIRSARPWSIKSTEAARGGDIFFEDGGGHGYQFTGQQVWARQLNIENEGTHLSNDGGQVWILGYKTERGGVLAHTLNGGKTEILGGFSYTTTAGKLAPMFVNEDSSLWTFFGEVCYNKDPFTTLVRETRNGETRELKSDAAHTAPYSGRR